MSLVQLSGEREILSEIESHVSGPWDHMEKIPEHIKQRLRERMIVALKAYYQGTAPKLAEPSPQQMLRMLGVAAGAEVAPEYLPLIRDQMGINAGERTRSTVTAEKANNFRVVIVGAGVSGICVAIKLQQAGIAYDILEKNDDVGGTWFENRYPGCAVDTPN